MRARGKTGVAARVAARLGQGPRRRRRCRRPLSSTREGPASDEASRESLGVTFTEAEEKDRIRQVVRLLYSGGDIDEAVREGMESGSIDRKTLAVLHRKVRTETERSSGESGVEGVEVGDDGIGGGAALRRALSSLYDKILREYQKQNLSPSMKLLGECLDVLLEEDEDETERLMGVKRLLDERFVRADLGLDPISAARLFAEAETNPSLQREIDSYLEERTQREAFVEEVQLRLRTLEREFQQQARTAREEDREGEEWIDRVERDNLSKARKRQQDQILKYLQYIIELASSSA